MPKLDDELHAILAPLSEREERLLAEKDELQQRLAEINSDIQVVSRVRKAAFPEMHMKKITAQKKTATKKVQGVSAEKISEVEAFLATKSEPTSVPEIKTALGYSEPTVSAALRVLRDQDRVRFVGLNERRGHTYLLMDNK